MIHGVLRWYYTKKHAPHHHKMPHYDEVNALVTLFAAFNTIARMGVGLCVDGFKHRVATVERRDRG